MQRRSDSVKYKSSEDGMIDTQGTRVNDKSSSG